MQTSAEALMGLGMASTLAEVVADGLNGVSVTLFGALGDGITDDTAAIQLAIDKAVSSGVRSVYLPAGTYLVSSTNGSGALQISSALTIYGDGPSTIIKLKSGSTGFVVHAYSATPFTGFVLRDLVVDGNSVTTAQMDVGLVQIQNVTWFLVDRVNIKNGTRASGASGINGISVSDGGTNVTTGNITNCLIENCSKALINWTSDARNALIQGNICRNGTGNGVTPGIQINGGFNGRIISNTIHGNQGAGILVATDSDGNEPRFAIIAFNHIYENGQGATDGQGIKITRATGTAYGRTIVANNIITGNGVGVNAPAISLINDRAITITGNFIGSHKFGAVALGGSTSTWDDALITDNTFENNNLNNNSGVGIIYMQGTISRVVITNNRFVDVQGTSTMWFPIVASTGTFTLIRIEDNDFTGMLNRQAISLDSSGTWSFSRIDLRYKYQSTDATVIPLVTFPVRDDSALRVFLEATGVQSGGSNRAYYELEDLWYRDGAGPARQGNIETTNVESDATWIGPTFTTSSNNLLLNNAGKAATTIDWMLGITLEID